MLLSRSEFYSGISTPTACHTNQHQKERKKNELFNSRFSPSGKSNRCYNAIDDDYTITRTHYITQAIK